VGSLLYYGLAVDPTILITISALASQQSTNTEDTNTKLLKLLKLLNYCATHPDSNIRYTTRDTLLERTGSTQQSRRIFSMRSKPKNREQQHNGALLTLSTILGMVVAIAVDAEMGALFLNAKEGVNIWNILAEMGHPQPVMLLQTDKTTTQNILRGTCKQKYSEAIDMRFYWARDHALQNQFNIGFPPLGTEPWGLLHQAPYTGPSQRNSQHVY
jgi:hypothetical protein